MEFSSNSWIVYLIVGIIIAAVLGQSVFFLVKALKRAKEKGMDFTKIKKIIITAATFTIAPAVAILVGVITLSVSLGIPLPWLRLSVIGSLSYEIVAAGNALEPLGFTMGTMVTDASAFVTVAWVMTLGIILGVVLIPIFTKKIRGGLVNMEKKDKKWFEVLNNAMFLGMISAFVGFVFCDVSCVIHGLTYGLVPVIVFFFAAIVMVCCAVLAKKFKLTWMYDYALPISLVFGMAIAIPVTMWLGTAPAEASSVIATILL